MYDSTRDVSAAGSSYCVRGVLDWHCLLAAVCCAAFREVACHDPAQHRSGLTLGCVRSFIHIGSQDASNSMCCSLNRLVKFMQTFATMTNASIAVKQSCMLHVAGQLCVVL